MNADSTKTFDPSDLLKRHEEVLSDDALKALAEVSADGTRTQQQIVEAVGMDALALIAVCQSIAAHPELDYSPEVSKLAGATLAHLSTVAAGFAEHETLSKIVTELREGYEASIKPPDGGTDHYPNDEISGVRAMPFFLPVGESFLPLLRVEILSERKSFPTMNLRLSLEDVAFLTAALLSGAVDTLRASAPLARHGLLFKDEVTWLEEMAASVSTGLERLKAEYQTLVGGDSRPKQGA